MIFTRAKKNETGFQTVLCKLISFTTYCLFGMHVSGQHVKDLTFRESALTLIIVTKGAKILNLTDSEAYIIFHQNTEILANKPLVYIVKSAKVVNLPESESFNIINQDVKRNLMIFH